MLCLSAHHELKQHVLEVLGVCVCVYVCGCGCVCVCGSVHEYIECVYYYVFNSMLPSNQTYTGKRLAKTKVVVSVE